MPPSTDGSATLPITAATAPGAGAAVAQDPAAVPAAPPADGKCAAAAVATPVFELSALEAFERRFKKANPWTPVTLALAAANLLVFALMAFQHQRLLEFNSHLLMKWGAAYAPSILTGQAWRLVTAMFVHDGLSHLAINLCFLLLLAPLVERLLGSLRFGIVYVFAGLGGTLLALGWFPSSVLVGASAAVYGVYGAFLGCYVGGLRTIPLCIFGRQGGIVLLFTLVAVLIDYLDLAESLIPHLGGLVFGFVGGLVFGHVLLARPPRSNMRLGVAGGVCVVLLVATGLEIRDCIRGPVHLFARYEGVRARERALLGRFQDELRRWELGVLSDGDLSRILQAELIPAWEKVRADLGMKLPSRFAALEQERLSLRDLFSKDASNEPRQKPPSGSPPSSYDEDYRLLLKLRIDTWRGFALALQNAEPALLETVMDCALLEVLREDLDDRVNADNPLRQWLEFSRRKLQERKQPGAGGSKR